MDHGFPVHETNPVSGTIFHPRTPRCTHPVPGVRSLSKCCNAARARARASLSHSLCMKHYKTLSRRNNIAHRCANLLGLRLRQSGESPYSVPHGFCAKLVLFDESNNKSRETSGTLSRAAAPSLFKYNSAQVSTKCAICGSSETERPG